MRYKATANERNDNAGTVTITPWELDPIVIADRGGKFPGLCPALWNQKKSAIIRNDLQLFDRNKQKTHGYLDHNWIADDKSKTSYYLLRSYNLKVFSFEKIAFIEQSENDWESRILPVFECPDIFFKDFNHFFVR